MYRTYITIALYIGGWRIQVTEQYRNGTVECVRVYCRPYLRRKAALKAALTISEDTGMKVLA
jgi:hypothetical protein